MTNKLISIGWLGDQRVYLNVTREEAMRRYEESEDEPAEETTILEFEFEDEFLAYDVSPL